MLAIVISSEVGAAIWRRFCGMTGSDCRFTPSAWTAESSSGRRRLGARVDLGGEDGVHARRNRLAQSATDLAADAGGMSKNMWKRIHFGAPQITKSMIHCVSWMPLATLLPQTTPP